MSTRYLVSILQFFAVSFVTALVVAAIAPVSSIRVMGLHAVSFATCGAALAFVELPREDPHALAVMRYRLLQPWVWTCNALARAYARLVHRAHAHVAP